MGNLKKITVFALCSLISSFCFAQQLSLQIVQYNESAKNVIEESFEIEDELINGFFEQGLIVTNSPAEISTSEQTDLNLWNTGLGDAFNGYSDFFVQVKIVYASPKNTTTGSANISEIIWKLASAKTGETIKESTIENLNVSKNDDIHKLSLSLIAQINGVLRSKNA